MSTTVSANLVDTVNDMVKAAAKEPAATFAPIPADISPQHPLLDRLHTLTHHVKARMHEAVRNEGEGLGPMEARALSFYARQPGSSQAALVQHSGRDKAQIARIVKLLLDRGLLQSAPDPADGRSLLLSPTDSGRTMQRRLHRQRIAIEAELMQRLTETQQRQLLVCLDRLLALNNEDAG